MDQNLLNSVASNPAAPSGETGETSVPKRDFQVSYEATATDRAAVELDDLLEVNTDVPQAVTAVNGALERIAQLRPKMNALPVDVALIDKVADYAAALAFVHALFSVDVPPPEGFQPLYEKLVKTRSLLRLDANNLAAHGIINEEALAGLKGDTGFHNVAYDVFSLVSLHVAASSKSTGRTALTAADLQQARTDASDFLYLLGQREQQVKDRSALNEQRRRAFTLLAKAYNEAQRAVTFLQWNEPEKRGLPSMYAARGAGRPKPQAPATPGTGANLPATNANSSTGSASTGSASTGATAVSDVGSGAQLPVSSAVQPTGARGGNPFGGE